MLSGLFLTISNSPFLSAALIAFILLVGIGLATVAPEDFSTGQRWAVALLYYFLSAVFAFLIFS